MNETEKRDALFRVAEERERKCMDMLVASHPDLSNLIHSPLETFAWNDGWLLSGTTTITSETKIRNKYIEDPIYLNTSKHFALLNMASLDGSLPLLFDFCVKSRQMLVVDLSRTGVTHSSRTNWHQIKERHITSNVTYYPTTSILDIYPLKYWKLSS